MDNNEIIRMAREAGFELDATECPCDYCNMELRMFERFAAIVAAHEREACAKVCEEYDVFGFGTRDKFAAAIRARSLK